MSEPATTTPAPNRHRERFLAWVASHRAAHPEDASKAERELYPLYEKFVGDRMMNQLRETLRRRGLPESLADEDTTP